MRRNELSGGGGLEGFGVLRLSAGRLAQDDGGWGGGGDQACGLALPGGEVAGGELDGVEDEAGATAVDGLGGEADGDLTEGVLDGFPVAGAGEVEFVVRNDGGGGIVLVMEAEVLIVHGVASAAAVGFGPEVALVRFVWIAVGAVAVEHGCPPWCSLRLKY